MSRSKGITTSSAISDYDRQERIIKEKRRNFIAKKAALIPPTQIGSNSSANSPPNLSDTQSSKSNLPFANDGSFFEQFMRLKTPDTNPLLTALTPLTPNSPPLPLPHTSTSQLQTHPPATSAPIYLQHPPLPPTKVKIPSHLSQPPLPPTDHTTDSNTPTLEHPPILPSAIKADFPSHFPLEHPPLPSTPSFPPPPPPPPVKIKLQPLNEHQLLTAPISIFQTEETHDTSHGSDGEDMTSEFEIAEKMARLLAIDGEHAIKEFKRVNKKDGPFSFLCHPSNPVALYFSQKLKEYQNDNDHILPVPTVPTPAAPTPPAPSEYTPRRKTRWSSEGESVKIPPSVLAAIHMAESRLNPTQLQQAEEQRTLNRLASSIRGGRGRGRGQKRFCGIKYEYDSDEENECGTWEHKRRAVEMQKTQETADQLTELGRGKHHLADYLPGDEYVRFMTQVEKAKIGDEVKLEYSDYKDHEIKQDNIGYQMLQRAGWHEGQGLGAQQQGIITPVNKGRSCLDSTGVGSERVADVKSGDDEFSLYRKRMMLAYKFRPNPLNNPRRPYYD